MNKMKKYFRGVAEEARRIRWPDQKTLWKAVAIVLSIAIVTALFITMFDYLVLYINRGISDAMKQGSTSTDSSSSSSSSSSASVSAAFRFINFFNIK